jgi:hypothetical protein
MRGPLWPRPALDLLDPRQHDLVDVQEAVLLEADVDERGLEAGQDVVDLALVDVADDRARAAALEVDLGDAIARGGAARLRASALLGVLRRRRAARRLHHGDAGLPTVDRDQHLLFQDDSSVI